MTVLGAKFVSTWLRSKESKNIPLQLVGRRENGNELTLGAKSLKVISQYC